MRNPAPRPAGIITLSVVTPASHLPAFAAAAAIYDHRYSQITGAWVGRCPPVMTPDLTTQQKIMPALDNPQSGIAVCHDDQDDLWRSWRTWYSTYGRNYRLVCASPWPSVTRFLSEAHDGPDFYVTAPHRIVDITQQLADIGRPSDHNVYLSQIGFEVIGPPGHPLRECRAIAATWLHIDNERRRHNRAAWVRPVTTIRRRNQCPHQDADGGTWIESTTPEERSCTACGRTWAALLETPQPPRHAALTA